MGIDFGLLLFFSIICWHLSFSATIHGAAVFQFGDSLSDTGNKVIAFPNASTSKAIVRPPYGMTFFHHPARRVSDGRLIVDFLATRLGLPFIDPYLGRRSHTSTHGVNFAVAGGTAISLETYKLENLLIKDTVDLNTQLEWFLEFQTSSSERLSPSFFKEALYIVGEIGGNDYARMWEMGWSPERVEPFVELAVESIGNHTRRLYEAGARRFMLVNLPVQGCNPRSLAMASPADKKDERLGCVLKIQRVGEKHNLKLRALLEKLQQELSEASFIYGDFYKIMVQVLENPQAYGITNIREACCGISTNSMDVLCGETRSINSIEIKGTACLNPSDHLFWNDNHFTEHFYHIVSDYFFDLLMSPQQTPAPYSALEEM